ncbi:MAG: peptidoglycan DD-metalloendopeptidase family protein [Actinomycetota bacterium]|nr:peptidoglycan DD-metalloendopeptidase family protein [Actinomycetota bacterium]
MKRLQGELANSLASVRAGQNKLDQVVRSYELARDRMEALTNLIQGNQARQDLLEVQLHAAKSLMNRRAASAYRDGPSRLVNVLMKATSFRQFSTAFGMIKAVTAADSRNLANLTALKGEEARLREALNAQRASQERLVHELEARQKQMQGSLAALGRQYEAVRSQLEKRKSGFTFPVRAPYSYTDSWGAPRMEGTRFFHSHEGTDIFALAGTPVYAVVDGVVEKMGVAPLGGNKLWLRSPGDNWSYYYAHLSGYAPGIRNGSRVRRGMVLGFVGNTGNARGTPPHLHFETHVPSGAATNPYPILKRVNPLK